MEDPITHDQELFEGHMRESYTDGVYHGIITTLAVVFLFVVALVVYSYLKTTI